jgi:hypothetical protein
MMHTKTARLALFALAAICMALLLRLPVNGLPESNIGLVRFEAFPSDSGVRLEWDVETEVGTAGYKIKRGEGGSFAFLEKPSGGDLFIVAEGGPALSASYTVNDDSASYGSTYVYQLVEVTTGSSEVIQGEVTLEVVVVPTNTPVTFSGGNGGGSGGGGNNAAATATATTAPTVTSAAATAPVSTAPPTRSAPTPLPTATAQPALSAAPTAVPPDAVEADGDAVLSSPPEVVQDTEAESFTLDGVVAVAEAQEEQPDTAEASYPGALPAVEQASEIQTLDNADSSVANQEIGSEAAKPIVIGAGDTSAGPQATAPAEETAPAQEVNSGGSGRLLLWIAFIVAMAIFIAAVIGAIYFYNRQRTIR